MDSDSASRSLVSVIMPVYNGKRYLAEALASVLEQDYPDLEVIVVDDGSTDGSGQLVRSVAETSRAPVRYVYQENQGPAAARNHGLQLAWGDLIAFQDADDVWTPDKLAIQVSYLQSRPTMQYVVCRTRFFLEPGCQPPPGFRPEWLTQAPPAYLMQTLLARRRLFDQIGRFDPSLSRAEDIDWFARLLDAQIPGHVIPRVLLHKRVHAANISLTGFSNNQFLLAALRRSVLRKQRKEEPRE